MIILIRDLINWRVLSLTSWARDSPQVSILLKVDSFRVWLKLLWINLAKGVLAIILKSLSIVYKPESLRPAFTYWFIMIFLRSSGLSTILDFAKATTEKRGEQKGEVKSSSTNSMLLPYPLLTSLCYLFHWRHLR